MVTEDQRWVVLGPNGAGKTTILQLAGAQIHPTSGRVEVLGEALGSVDVFDLRPRIGLASAILAERIPADERVRDVVVTAAWAVTGRGLEAYEDPDTARGLATSWSWWAPTRSPSGSSARCRRGSASGCRSPAP